VDIHNITIAAGDIQKIASQIESAAGVSAQATKLSPLVKLGFVDSIFSDVDAAVKWLEGLVGDFCSAYNNGHTTPDGQKITLKQALQAAQTVLSALNPAAAAAVGIAITVLNEAC